MRASVSGVSERRSCQVLHVSRAGLHRGIRAARRRGRTEPPWLERLRYWIQQHPTFGYRRLWVQLRCRDRLVVNRKAVYLVLKQQGWFVHQRSPTPRPRARGWISRASRSNERWAMDVTHIPCGHDGWAHLAAVIDCHDREVIGYEFALRSRAQEAERAIEAACLQRFGTLRPVGGPPQRQWADLSEPAVPASLSRLSTPTRIHYTVHTGAEWGHRTVLSQSQRGVYLAARVSDM